MNENVNCLQQTTKNRAEIMAKLPLASFILFTLRISFSFSSNSDIIYFFPLNDSTTIKGVIKNGFCTDLSSTSIQGSSPSTVEGPDTSQSDPAVNLGPDNWINLGDFTGTCISNPGLCTSGMTVAFWVRLDAGGSGDRHVINTGKLDTSRGIQVFYTNSHTNVVLCDGTKRYPAEIAFPSYWTHVVAVYDPTGSTASDKFYVYVNGTQKETARYETSCTLADTDTSLLVGHDNAGALSAGREVALSQLTFFFRSLNQTEAQQIYSNPSSGIQLNCPEPPTTAASTTAPTTTTAAATSNIAATTTGANAGASTVAPTTGSASNTSAAAETTSSSSVGGATPSPESSGSPLGQGQEKNNKSRSPTVLILLSTSLFFLILILIILIIGCCIIAPRAKEKGYKCL